jgi:hypothetical protein
MYVRTELGVRSCGNVVRPPHTLRPLMNNQRDEHAVDGHLMMSRIAVLNRRLPDPRFAHRRSAYIGSRILTPCPSALRASSSRRRGSPDSVRQHRPLP